MRKISSSTGDVASPKTTSSAPLTPVCGLFAEGFPPRFQLESSVNGGDDSIRIDGSSTEREEVFKISSRNFSFKENLRNVLRSSKRMNSLPAPVHGPRFGAISPKGMMTRKEAVNQSIDETLAEKDKEGSEDKNDE